MAEIRVADLFTAPTSGAPMQEHKKASLIAGQGIEGDRYATGKGKYSQLLPFKIRHVTFIAEAAIAEANKELVTLGVEFAPIDTRRNILLCGIEPAALNALAGKFFATGDVLFEGKDLADPCKWPPSLLKERWRAEDLPKIAAAFKAAFNNRGGLRALVHTSGNVWVDTPVRVLDDPEDVLDYFPIRRHATGWLG
ncbi:hypothetical protein HY091_00035 [Candidatus Kaiserbacteria bacterium]|nr:hypothetical protein [Candidatus Kaiserbacteria bacterium]